MSKNVASEVNVIHTQRKQNKGCNSEGSDYNENT